MCVEVRDLPQEVLGYIFSSLSPKDLGRAAQVCRGWNSTSKLEWVCQNVARSILDLSEPCDGSWEKQLPILHRWKEWKPQEFPIPDLKRMYKPGEFCVLLEDSTALEVVRLDRGSYSVRNLFNHEELRQINVQQFGCADIFRGAVHGTIWTIRDISGKIFQFDIKTGDCINQFIGEAVPQGNSSDIHSSDDEIITRVQNRVQIWDLQRRRLSQTLTIGEEQEIWNKWTICSTPNFVLCLAERLDSFSVSLCAVNKKDQKIQARIGLGLGAVPLAFESYGSYCSVLIQEESVYLHVYEDTPDAQFQLVRTHLIQEVPSRGFGTVQMYRNWVCVYKSDAFCVFDVRTGKEVVSLKRDWGLEVQFQINAQALLVSQAIPYDVAPGPRRETPTPCLYDFSGKVQQIPSSGRCSVM